MPRIIPKFKAFLDALGACRPGIAWGRKARAIFVFGHVAVRVVFVSCLELVCNYVGNIMIILVRDTNTKVYTYP